MKEAYLFGSRIATHVLFWLVYYLSFSLIWANDGQYVASFFLEFVLLPIRMAAVYLTIYWLMPQYLLQARWQPFLAWYLGLLLVCGLGQRAILYFFYEPALAEPARAFLSAAAIGRAMILINSTVLFVAGIKLVRMYWALRAQAEEGTEEDTTLEVRADKRNYRLEPDDIRYLEGLGNYVTYHLADGRKLVSYGSMKEALADLPEQFVRIHKSFAVNRSHVQSYSSENVEVGDKLLPLGKAYREEFSDVR